MIAHLLFDTPVGRCGLAWCDGAISALQLPEPDDRATLRRMLRRTALAEAGQPAAADDPSHADALAASTLADGRPALPSPITVDEAPPWVHDVIAQIDALLAGQPQRLHDVPLDLRGIPDFHRRVYDYSRGIPPGQTLTYGQVAQALGAPGASRAVGQALGSNPFAVIVPCHRVLAADGRSGGFSANGGVRTKLRLLALEGQGQPLPGGDLFGWNA